MSEPDPQSYVAPKTFEEGEAVRVRIKRPARRGNTVTIERGVYRSAFKSGHLVCVQNRYRIVSSEDLFHG